MNRQHLAAIVPAFLIAFGILISTALTVTGSGWLIAIGVALFALSTLAGDLAAARLRGQRVAPSVQGIAIAASFLLACGIVALKNPALVATLIPVIGGAAVLPIIFRGGKVCC
jgi:hypothetical protein